MDIVAQRSALLAQVKALALIEGRKQCSGRPDAPGICGQIWRACDAAFIEGVKLSRGAIVDRLPYPTLDQIGEPGFAFSNIQAGINDWKAYHQLKDVA